MVRVVPSLVLFDLDGVLVEYDRNARVRHLAAAVSREAAHVHAALFDSGLESRFDAGALDPAHYLGELGDALGCRVDRECWAAARGASMRLLPGTAALVDAVARRCDVAVLTNNGGLLAEMLPRLLPPLFPGLAGRVLCSGLLGAAKPELRAFELALERLGHESGRTLFLDDNAANVEGARAAGLNAELVRHPTALGTALARHGLP